ncbi:hypothetical protein HanIR_Chr15g0738201 [Helianthus annuus]|nr:hypothetical protein HanIR_Chr15g0738201 [Helianthus annuus]
MLGIYTPLMLVQSSSYSNTIFTFKANQRWNQKERLHQHRIYQDFEPSMEWVPEDDSDTLLIYLPGFAKEQLRVST